MTSSQPGTGPDAAAAPGNGATPTRVIALLAAASFASAANVRMCDPLLPLIAGELGVTVGNAAIIVTAFAVAYGLSQLVIGPLGDARGKLLVVVIGTAWAGIATLLCAAMPTLGLLAFMRLLAGAGAAAVIPLAMAWIGDVIPYERRQPILARFLSGQILGIVFGQAAGGLLGDLIGWRAAMLLLGVTHLVTGFALYREMRRAPHWNRGTGRANFERAAAAAIELLSRPWVRVVLLSVFLEGVAMFGAFAYVGAELHQRFGASFGTIGAVLAAFGAGALFYSLTAGRLVAWLGQKGLAAWGSILLVIGYLMLTLMPWMWLAVPAIAINGLGFYMLHNTLQTNATQMAPDARGLGVSLFALALFVGQSVGVALAAPVMDRFGARPIFLVAGAILLTIAFWFRQQLIAREKSAD